MEYKIPYIVNLSVVIAIGLILLLSSCVMDSVSSFCIRNCTDDTLLIVVLAEDKSLDKCIYYDGECEGNNVSIMPEDTTWTYIDGKLKIIDKFYCALPDSIVLFDPRVFRRKDTCYLYSIKWNTLLKHSIEEIRTRRMYRKQPITKKNFQKRYFNYR